MGGEQFRQALLAQAAKALKGKRRESHAREDRQLHDQGQAEKMLGIGLKLLNVRRTALGRLPKGQLEKQVLAWWLYGNTTVRRRWVAEQLEMGYETRVSQAASYVQRSQSPAVASMKEKLAKYGI